MQRRTQEDRRGEWEREDIREGLASSVMSSNERETPLSHLVTPLRVGGIRLHSATVSSRRRSRCRTRTFSAKATLT